MRGKEVRQRKRRRSGRKPKEYRVAVRASRGGRVREGGREGTPQGQRPLRGLRVQGIGAPSMKQPEKRPENLAAYRVLGGPWGVVSGTVVEEARLRGLT